jgi:hypothetical protein
VVEKPVDSNKIDLLIKINDADLLAQLSKLHLQVKLSAEQEAREQKLLDIALISKLENFKESSREISPFGESGQKLEIAFLIESMSDSLDRALFLTRVAMFVADQKPIRR